MYYRKCIYLIFFFFFILKHCFGPAIIVLNFHLIQSPSHLSLTPVHLHSSLSLTTPKQFFFVVPLILIPFTHIYFTNINAFVPLSFITCLNHLNLLSLILSTIKATLALYFIYKFPTLSYLVLLLSYLIILIFVTLNIYSYIIQHSDPYAILAITTALLPLHINLIWIHFYTIGY